MEFKMIEALRYAAQGCTGTLEPEWVTLKEATENFERLFSLLEQFGINAQNMTPELEDAINAAGVYYWLSHGRAADAGVYLSGDRR